VLVVPYGWMSGITGDVGVGGVVTHVDVPFRDVFKVLKVGAIGGIEVRNGHWLAAGDFLYVSLGDRKSVVIRGDTGSLEVAQQEVIAQPMAGYSIGNAQWAVDVMTGIRFWHMSALLRRDGLGARSPERSGGRGWVDALGAARFRMSPVHRLHIIAGGDGGAGASRGTWQAHAEVGVDVSSHAVVGAGYRDLSVNYNHRNVVFDTRTHGPALWASFAF
jgi:hypothetical protein